MFSPFVFTGLSFMLLLRISYNRFYLLVETLPNNGDGSGGGGKSKRGGGGKGISKIYGCGMEFGRVAEVS
jgi:hypothetical protein